MKLEENHKVLIAKNESLKSQNQQYKMETIAMKKEVMSLKQSLTSKQSQLTQTKQVQSVFSFSLYLTPSKFCNQYKGKYRAKKN